MNRQDSARISWIARIGRLARSAHDARVRRADPLLLPVILLAALLGMTAPALAGPNEGGMLVLHYESNLVFTLDGDWSGWSSVPNRSCENINTQVPEANGQGVIFFVMAAFPDYAIPRLKGVSFGIEFDNPLCAPAAWGSCGGFQGMEIPTPGWPAASGSGISLVYDTPVNRRLNEVCWFAAYAYPGEFRVIEHPDPRIGGYFGDDAVPPELDRIEAFGTLGFGRPGENPCASDETTGACCTREGQCLIQTRDACAWQGYTYMGDYSECSPNPCVPGMGACCVRTECVLLPFDDCLDASGTYMGLGSGCDPTPCDFRPIDTTWGKMKSVYRSGY